MSFVFGQAEAIAAMKFKVGDLVQALFTDKKFHDAKIIKIASIEPPKYTVQYVASRKGANIPERGIRKGSKEAERLAAAAAAKAAAKEKQDAQKAADAQAVKDSANIKWASGDKCLAMSNDGRWFEAEIVKVKAFDMFDVKFSETGVQSAVSKKKLRAWALLPKTAPKASAKGGRGGQRNGQKGGQRQGSAARGRGGQRSQRGA